MEGTGATTSALVDGALEELLEVGQAAFTMEGVARRSYFSVGAVYDRWPDKPAVLAYLAEHALPEQLKQMLAGFGDVPALVTGLTDGGSGQRVMALVGESLLAAHTMEAVREPAVALVDQLMQHLRSVMGPGMAWYIATTSLGQALLGLLDIRLVGRDQDWVRLMVDAVEAEGSAEPPGSEGSGEVISPPLPEVPGPVRHDPVSRSLVEAARLLLQEAGVSGTTTRDIAASAGVTTGALYRRYPGKSGLLADVLLTELDPDRYAWTWDLIKALASEEPYTEAAEVMARRLIETSQDLSMQRILMQVGIAARNDPALRVQVAARIAAAQQARAQMVEHFMAAGIMRPDIPADAYAWGFQTLPVGNRALLPVGRGIEAESARSAMRAVMIAAAAQ